MIESSLRYAVPGSLSRTRPEHDLSVYYEAGFADGLGTPVIWTCAAKEKKEIAFDTRQNEHILWTDASDLRKQLSDKIARRGWKRN